MKIVNLKLPDNYIPVFEEARKELYQAKSKIIYIYSPPAYGKTTTLIKFFEDTNFHPVFIQIEDKDWDIDTFKISLLQILSEFSGSLKETISLIEGRELPKFFESILENEYKNILLPENTYFVFLDTYHLMENFEKIIKKIILPVFKNLDSKVIIEANLPYEFEEDVKIIGTELFTLSIEEILKMGDILGEKLSYEEASLLKEKTEGWILPCILFFKDKRDTKTKLKSLLEGPELLEGLLEENFKNLNEEEKISVLTLAQLREFNHETISWMLRINDPEKIINRLKETGFALIEERKNGFLSFRFHRLIKSYLEEKLKKFPLGYDLFFRIHFDALEYFESIGDFENAIYHAIKAGDSTKCGNYLKTIITELFMEGKIQVIENFLSEIKQESIKTTPEILFCEGIYLNLVEKYKESVKVLNKIIKELKDEDYLVAKYFILVGKVFLGEKDELLIEEGEELLKEIFEYEKKYEIEFDFEKDPLKIIKRKAYKSRDYFVSLMYDRVYNFLGNRYYSKKEIKKAREFYEKSLLFSKKIGDKRREFVTVNNIGLTFLFEGEKEALKYFLEPINTPYLFPTKAHSFENLGIYYEIIEGDLDKAEENYKKALELFERFEERCCAFSSTANLVYLYLKKKEKKEIEKCLKKLEELASEIKIEIYTNYLYLYMTEIFLHLDRVQESENVFKKVKDIFLTREEEKYYKVYVEGKLKYLKGDIEQGKDLINKSLEWSFLKGNFSDKIEKLYYLYEIYKKFNDPEIIKIRKMAENLLREKNCLKRLKDFDIE